MLPSLANSSGSALAQKPLWDTRSGQAYLGSESGWMRDGSLLVKPSRSAPLQQHCFFVIWVAGAWPQADPQPSLPAPAISEPKGKGLSPSLQTTPGRLLWRVTLPSSPTIGSPLLLPGTPTFPHQLLSSFSHHLPMATPLSTSFSIIQGRLRKE